MNRNVVEPCFTQYVSRLEDKLNEEKRAKERLEKQITELKRIIEGGNNKKVSTKAK